MYCVCLFLIYAFKKQFASLCIKKTGNFFAEEAISKLLKIVKAPSLRSVKGSVFPPSHKATAGQAPVTLQVASANYPLQLFANGIESHFLNDF